MTVVPAARVALARAVVRANVAERGSGSADGDGQDSDGTEMLLFKDWGTGQPVVCGRRLAAERGRVRRSDDVSERARVPLRRPRPPGPRSLEPALEWERHGYVRR